MPRMKKDYEPVSIKMDKEISKRLTEYCVETGLTKTVAIERAISMYISDYDKKKRILESQND